MFLEIDELKSVLYSYQMNEIAEGDTEILEDAIDAAIEEVKSYLKMSNQKRFTDGRPRYDIVALFAATGTERNGIILRRCKTIAAWYVCELSNVDVIYDQLKERYDRAIDWLEKVAGVGKYAGEPTITPDLPVLDEETDTLPNVFHISSHKKFDHGID
jgi:phage gp36-like protein